MRPFSEVVAEHGAMVLRVCRSMLGPVDADDAWSEAFLAAMRAYPDLDENANVAGWLVVIARRKCIDFIRRRDRAAVPVSEGLDQVGLEDVVEEADDDLRRALGGLSERQRTAVVAHHVAGLPYAEVAVLLETSPDAARRSAADGIAKLRTLYRKDLNS